MKTRIYAAPAVKGLILVIFHTFHWSLSSTTVCMFLWHLNGYAGVMPSVHICHFRHLFNKMMTIHHCSLGFEKLKRPDVDVY